MTILPVLKFYVFEVLALIDAGTTQKTKLLW